MNSLENVFYKFYRSQLYAVKVLNARQTDKVHCFRMVLEKCIGILISDSVMPLFSFKFLEDDIQRQLMFLC